MSANETRSEIAAEQAHIDRAYDRLAELRANALGLAQRALAADPGGHGQIFLDREELIHAQERRLADLHLGDEQPLVFGRMDLVDGDTHHIGRIGVHDAEHEPLVVDWRAPIAEAFYRATAAAPMELVRRRHILCKGRRVVGLDDEVIDGVAVTDSDLNLVGEAALLAAVDRSRTGRMTDIVATIQAEQDVIVRAPLAGVLCVQGGPGTGKTAVALHRVAYLLYTHRFQLEDHGVLVIGPSPLFLRYVEQVLPSLGEEAVTMATLTSLVPPTRVTGHDEPETAHLKGDLRMLGLLEHAVADRERHLRRTIRIPYGRTVLELTPSGTRRIIDRARRRRGSHNDRRPGVERALLSSLFDQWDRRRRRDLASDQPDPLGTDDARNDAVDDFRREVRRRPEWREAIERMWPVLSPHELLHDLFGSRALLRSAGASTLGDDVALLHRPRRDRPDDVAWTMEDVPLIDAAWVLLGDPPARQRKGEEDGLAAWNRDQLTADLLASSDFTDREMALVRDDRWDREPTVELRNWDRTWAHVVVDEAQELSPMGWRMLARRCPRASMTIVGDLGQAASDHAPRHWVDLEPALPGRRPPTVAELTVNYRTPADLMERAARVLSAVAPELTPPVSVRDTGRGIHVVEAAEQGAIPATVELTRGWLTDSTGTIAVIAPDELLDELAQVLDVPADPPDLAGRDLVLLSTDVAKGLEFDDVIIVEPSAITGDVPTPSGLRTLYVSMTRPTQRLALVHARPLPEVLGDDLRSTNGSAAPTADGVVHADATST